MAKYRIRRKMTFTLLAGLLWAGQIHGETANPPHNILLIVADDLGTDRTPGYGSISDWERASMPVLEGLMDRGVTFDNVWSCPLCAPTRASLLTGKYGFRTGVTNLERDHQLDRNEIILPALLDSATGTDYRSALIGKWHVTGRPEDPEAMGFDFFSGIMGGAVEDYYRWDLTTHSQKETCTEYATEKLTDLAIEWIARQNEPWFCMVSYNAPHTPFQAPPDELSDGSGEGDDLSLFLDMTEAMDREIGRLIHTLGESWAEDTLILFMGDNGTEALVSAAAQGRRAAKGSLYEGGIHVPLVAAGAGVERSGERENAPVNVTDILPTLLQAAGSEESSYEDGMSFYPLLSEGGEGLRTVNFSQLEVSGKGHAFLSCALGDGQFKWTFALTERGIVREKFYDLRKDPLEEGNLLIRGQPLAEGEASEALSLFKNYFNAMDLALASSSSP